MGYGVVPDAPVRCDGELGLIRGTCSRSSDGLYGVTTWRGGWREIICLVGIFIIFLLQPTKLQGGFFFLNGILSVSHFVFCKIDNFVSHIDFVIVSLRD